MIGLAADIRLDQREELATLNGRSFSAHGGLANVVECRCPPSVSAPDDVPTRSTDASQLPWQAAVRSETFMVIPRIPKWTWVWPGIACLLLLLVPVLGTGGFVGGAAGIVLLTTVFAAVYHAEMVAHRVGEPFGTLILALAVTVIETALIVSVMIAAPAEKAGLARDTVFAAVMIVCNGIVGACLLWGGVRHHEQGFQAQGASAALAVLVALTSLTMVLPNLAAPELGPLYNKPQLVFAGLVSLVLYFSFVFIQTVRHRDYFLLDLGSKPEEHVSPPDNRSTILSAVLLVVSLAAVVGLGKALTPTIERGID